MSQRVRRVAELRFSIHDQITPAVEESIFEVGQFAGCLFHPGFVRTRCTTSKVNTARLQFHDQQQVERHQSTLGPDFARGEINRREYIPMSFEKYAPCSRVLAVRSRASISAFWNSMICC
jgi:hypothetical protein